MTQPEIEKGNVTFATFMGWQKQPSGTGVDWKSFYWPPGLTENSNPLDIMARQKRVDHMKYHTSYDWFVPVWSKAIKEFDTYFPATEGSPAFRLAENIRPLITWDFTLEVRYPLLIQIIEFLNSQKK